MVLQSSQPTTDQPLPEVGWKTIQLLVALNLPYLVLVLGPYFCYGIPWRESYSDPRDFWPYGYEGLGAFTWFLARAVAEVTPFLLPLMAIMTVAIVRPFWQQQGRRAKVIISLCIAVAGLVGASSWFLNPDVTYWLYD
jgi:hypothetical protein